MKKILLLNLPYKNKKFQRDFSCPHSSKADYYWPPLDLVVYSAILSDQELSLIDSVQEGLQEKETIEKVKEVQPDYIFTIISAISLHQDLNLISQIKKDYPNIKICASGDLCSFEPKTLLKTKEIDFILQDFTEKEEIRKILFNKQKKKIIRSSKNKEFKIGIPRYELFKKYDYRMPYSHHKPVASIITNYGCPFSCKFCNSSNMKFKPRDTEETIEDMKYAEKVGFKEAYMRDFTFGLPRIEKLLGRMLEEKLNLKWSCEFRVDLVNEPLLRKMKQAGCFLIFYGGESGNQKTLDLMNKGFSLNQVKEAVAMTKKIGIETLISFIIGFHSETEEEVGNTKKFIFEIDPDYLSLNILVPRVGSDFRKEINSEEGEKLDNSEEKGIRYPSGKFAMDYKRSIERGFFFRPSKMLKYFLFSMETPGRFKNLAKSGMSIFFKTYKK